MTLKQIESLKEFAEQFINTKQLYSLQLKPLTMMPYIYGKAIESFKFCAFAGVLHLQIFHIKQAVGEEHQQRQNTSTVRRKLRL